MLFYTEQQVINKAAGDLGRLVPGEALGAVEETILTTAFNNVLSEISKIISINDPNLVPAVAFECVAVLTALFAASDFSNAPIDYNAIENVEQRLRYLLAQTPTYEPLASYYF